MDKQTNDGLPDKLNPFVASRSIVPATFWPALIIGLCFVCGMGMLAMHGGVYKIHGDGNRAIKINRWSGETWTLDQGDRSKNQADKWRPIEGAGPLSAN